MRCNSEVLIELSGIGKRLIDREIIELIQQINRFSAIRTTCSCCGHGEDSIMIWIMPDGYDMPKMSPLLYWFDPCHSGTAAHGWKVKVYTDCSMCDPRFVIESTSKGEKAYEEARIIANHMKTYLDEEEQSE